jgi:hypothetical protein
MIYKNIKERHEHKIEMMDKEIQVWIDISKDKDYKISLLENQLKEYYKLQGEVHLGIERVWSIDSYDYSNNPYDVKERSEIIEEVFYKIANEWIGGEGLETQKRTDPERWESLDDMDGSWTEDDIEKGHHLPF